MWADLVRFFRQTPTKRILNVVSKYSLLLIAGGTLKPRYQLALASVFAAALVGLTASSASGKRLADIR
jgi:hypothetical protein